MNITSLNQQAENVCTATTLCFIYICRSYIPLIIYEKNVYHSKKCSICKGVESQ